MITKIQYKKLDGKGLRNFTVQKDLTLEILTEDKSKEGITKTFIQGGTFVGEPILAKLSRRSENGNWIQYGEGKGFIVRNEDNTGAWLIPIKVTAPPIEKAIENIVKNSEETVVSDIQHDLDYINNNPQKKYFGFTAKQLIIIGIALLIVRKL
jgi:hypothetical protein